MIRSFFRRPKVCGAVLLAAAGICVLLLALSVRIIWSSGQSMAPTLKDGQLLIATPACNPFVTPQPGDIVVVRCDAGRNLIKRLIALPGETVQVQNGWLSIDGSAVCESYLPQATVTSDIPPVTLGEDSYYVLGDNRSVSADSRYYGTFSGCDIMCVVDLEHQWLHWGLFLLLAALVYLLASRGLTLLNL